MRTNFRKFHSSWGSNEIPSAETSQYIVHSQDWIFHWQDVQWSGDQGHHVFFQRADSWKKLIGTLSLLSMPLTDNGILILIGDGGHFFIPCFTYLTLNAAKLSANVSPRKTPLLSEFGMLKWDPTWMKWTTYIPFQFDSHHFISKTMWKT